MSFKAKLFREANCIPAANKSLAFLPLNHFCSLCFSHAGRAFLTLFSPALPQSNECISHMPHSHDITGLRGTLNPKDLLHDNTLELYGRDDRKG